MKIQLPNGKKKVLSDSIPIDEKLMIVESLVSEWADVIQEGWETNSIRFFLNGLADYLVWHKEIEEKNKHDKEVLSISKVKQMSGKVKSNNISFSNLSLETKILLGIAGENDHE